MRTRHLLAPLVGLAILAGCSSEPDLSLDQQQQAWEEETEQKACEFYRDAGEDHLKLGQSMDTLRTGKAASVAEPRLNQSGCSGVVYGRYLHERLVRGFPESPKGQAGETTSPSVP